MNRGDWKFLALIGCCGLVSFGATAALLSPLDQGESCDLRVIEVAPPEVRGAPPVILHWRGEPSPLPPGFGITKEGRIQFRDGTPLGLGTEGSLFYPSRSRSGIQVLDVPIPRTSHTLRFRNIR